MKSLFPVGTVVRLKGDEINTMIIGYGGKGNDSGDVFDYVGVPMPCGFLGKETIAGFNDASIEKIAYFGYRDAAAQQYISKVMEASKDELPLFKN